MTGGPRPRRPFRRGSLGVGRGLLTRLRGVALLTSALVGAALLMPILIALANPLRDRVSPDDMQELAAAALTRARTAGAAGVAPINLGQSEDAYAEALLERRRQELRPGLTRDYRRSTALLSVARQRAEQALAIVEATRHRARRGSARALEAARRALVPLEGVEEHLWIPREVRTRLTRARVSLAEGAALAAGGAYPEAERAAREARVAAADVSEAVWAATRRYVDPSMLEAWRSSAAETVAWSKRTGRVAIVVAKDEHTITLYDGGRAVVEYAAELGWNNTGDKRRQGDGATPEGRYRIVELKGRERSRYHRALLLDYPNHDDLQALAHLERAGAVPPGVRAGGLIEIHGGGGRGKDWTDGCIAVTDREVEQLFRSVRVGTPVTVVGSRNGAGRFAQIARRVAR